MRTSVMRNALTNYRDIKPARHLPMMLYALLVSVVLTLVITLPLGFLSTMFQAEDGEGAMTTFVYTLNVALGPLFIYLAGVPTLLLTFMSTLDHPRYAWRDVPALIKRNRKRFVRGVAKSIAIPMLFVALYWLMIQRVPIELPAFGIWLWNAFIATRFALMDSYRVYRDDMTMMDSFGYLMPKKMRKDEAEKRNILNKVPFFTFGDGVLAVPLIQAVVICMITLVLTNLYRGNPLSDDLWAWFYTVTQTAALWLYVVLFKLIDAYKWWGEKGKLSIVRDGSGAKLERVKTASEQPVR